MLKKFIPERFFCGLDIGSQSIKASVIKCKDESQPELLGVFETKTIGFRQASISDLGDLSDCIHRTIAGLANKTGIKLKEVQLGISGEMIENRFSTAVIPLTDKGSKVITQRDMKKVQNQARLLGVQMEEIVIHDFPLYYRVDDVNKALNPIGLYGRKLETKSMLIVVNNTFIKNLSKAVNQSGYEVTKIFSTSFASSWCSTTEEERRHGCILIDVGSTITELLIFKDGLLQFFKNIPIGGELITRKIAGELNLGFDIADEIKRSYAVVNNAMSLADEEILIKKDEGYIPIKKEKICHAIEAVVQRLVESTNEAINESHLYDQINHGVIMVGGGSLLSGLPERIEETIKLPVKMGKVDIADKKLKSTAKYAAVVGLAQTAMKKKYDAQLISDGQDKWTHSVVNRVKDFYQEYF